MITAKASARVSRERKMTGTCTVVATSPPTSACPACGVSFLRSPVAHALITSQSKPQGYEDSVFFHSDLAGVAPITTRSSIPGYKVSDYPALATGRVRFVGETVAMCVADNRAVAEDLCELVEVDYEELPVIVTSSAGRRRDAALLHRAWGDNLFLETSFDRGMDDIAKRAPVAVELAP